MIGEEAREFENVLTAGATGYSQRDLKEMTRLGAVLSAGMAPIPSLQETGSHLVISPNSRLLQPTHSSAASAVIGLPSGKTSPQLPAPSSPQNLHAAESASSQLKVREASAQASANFLFLHACDAA